MSEIKPSLPREVEQQRLIAVHAFSIAALGFNGWVYSEGAREDVGMDFRTLQQGHEHPRIDGVEWRRNLAAMRIMQALTFGIVKPQPLVILPEIPAAEDLYKNVDEAVERVGLNRLPSYDLNILGPPIKCFLKDIEPEDKVSEIVQQARQNRGVVQQEVTTIDEMVEAMENSPEEETLVDLQVTPGGILAEVHRFPESPTRVVEIPFYQQYVSPSGGAVDYLNAYIEDVNWVSSQL